MTCQKNDVILSNDLEKRFFAFRAIVGLYKTVMMIGAYINATYYSSILYLIVSYTFVKCRLTICLVKGVSICWTNSKCTLPNNYYVLIEFSDFFFIKFSIFISNEAIKRASAQEVPLWSANIVLCGESVALKDFNKIIGECFASLFVFCLFKCIFGCIPQALGTRTVWW